MELEDHRSPEFETFESEGQTSIELLPQVVVLHSGVLDILRKKCQGRDYIPT